MCRSDELTSNKITDNCTPTLLDRYGVFNNQLMLYDEWHIWWGRGVGGMKNEYPDFDK